MISGKACINATKPYAKKHPNLPYSKLNNLTVSKTSIGTRDLRAPNVLIHAIRNGINSIDTASNFNNDHIISKALSSPLINRNELILTTKAGYINQKDGASFSPIAHISDNVSSHCIAPEYLESELLTSLDRLNVDYIDVFLINSPERMLLDPQLNLSPSTLHRMLQTSLNHLQKFVDRGLIGCFGICSNSFTNKKDAGVQIDKLLNDPNEEYMKGFKVVQYPFNLFEHSVLENGVSDLVKGKGIFRFTNRPLNAIRNGQVNTLRSTFPGDIVTEAEATAKISKNIENLFLLENQLSEKADVIDLSTSPQILSKFVWSDAITENIPTLTANLFTTQFFTSKKLIPTVNQDITKLSEFLVSTNQVDDELSFWIEKYKKTIQDVCDSLLASAVSQAHSKNSILLDKLNMRLDEDMTTLQELAIGVVEGSGASDSCVVGLDEVEYIDEVLKFGKVKDKKELMKVIGNSHLL